jgi:hypothetical protein
LRRSDWLVLLLVAVAAGAIPLKLLVWSAPPQAPKNAIPAVAAFLQREGLAVSPSSSGATVTAERADCQVAVTIARPEGGDEPDFVSRLGAGKTVAYVYRGSISDHRPATRGQIDLYFSRILLPFRKIPVAPIFLVAYTEGCGPKLMDGLTSLSSR